MARRAVVGHAIFEHQSAKSGTHQTSLLAAQIEDAGDQRAVVPLSRRPRTEWAR